MNGCKLKYFVVYSKQLFIVTIRQNEVPYICIVATRWAYSRSI